MLPKPDPSLFDPTFVAPYGPTENVTYYLVGEAPGCISGDSLIEVAFRDKSEFPKGVPIKDLVDKSGFHVYSFDIESRSLTLGMVTKVWCTGKKPVYRVTYEWRFAKGTESVYLNDSIIVTGNHPFLLKKYIEHDPFMGRSEKCHYLSIDEGLKVGHSLQPFHRRVQKGYAEIGTSHKTMCREGRYLLGYKLNRILPREEECHHINENKLDDTWNNITLLTTEDHARHHAIQSNPMNAALARENHQRALRNSDYRNDRRIQQLELLKDKSIYEKRKTQVITSGVKTRFVKGSRWITDGVNNKQVPKNYQVPSDWRYGRTISKDNHKIIKIEFLGEIDVYDMEVEKYHNFAVNGIFVHNSEEVIQRKPFVGVAGRCLDQMLSEVGIDREQVRICNTIPYRPYTASKTANRTPTDAEIKQFSELLRIDIQKVNPKVIICMGRSATIGLGFEVPSINRCLGEQFSYNDIPTFITYHASYVNRTATTKEDWKSSPYYGDVVGSLRQAIEFQRQVDFNNTPPYEAKILDAFKFEELKQLEELFPNEEITITTDYEASGLNTYHQKFHIAGIGFGSISQPDKTCYVYFYDGARHPSTHGPIPQDSIDYIRAFLEKHEHIVYNAQYESSVTYSQFDKLRLTFTDLLAWVRCINQSGSLKNVAQRRLGIARWNDDVEVWVESLAEFQDAYKKMLLVKKCTYADHVTTAGDSFASIMAYAKNKAVDESLKQLNRVKWEFDDILAKFKFCNQEYNVSHFKLQEPELTIYLTSVKKPITDEAVVLIKNKDILLPRSGNVGRYEFIAYEKSKKITDIIQKYYGEDERQEILTKIFERAKFRISLDEYEVNYADVPLKIISSYCCGDIVNTTRLYHDVRNELKERGLAKAADYFNRQVYLGFELALSGIAWDDDLATVLHDEFNREALESHRSLLLKTNFPVILNLTEADKLEIAATTELEVLKNYFKPNSNHHTTRTKFSQLVTTKRFRLAKIFYELDQQTQQGKKTDLLIRCPILYPLYQKLISLPIDRRQIALSQLAAKWELLLSKAKQYSGDVSGKLNGQNDDLRFLIQFENYDLTSLDDESVKELYDIFVLFYGLDIENQVTWPPEFWAVYYFRVNKKAMKALTTYVEGEAGRKRVSIVPKSAVLDKRLMEVATRLDREKTEDEIYISATEWNVNGARTSRWRSKTHTIPANSELQDLKISRYDDGIRLHADFSQMELRILAVMSKDQKFLNAFARGVDIHRFVASRIWHLVESEVSKAQRRQSKECSFSLIYGKTVAAFAADFTNGNVEEAQYIFDSIFGEFPGIRDYIIESHYMALDKGYVTSIFGSIIDPEVPQWALTMDPGLKTKIIEDGALFSRDFKLADDGDEDRFRRKQLGKALRNAQNYRIQSSASHIAALAIQEIVDYTNANNFFTRADCFTHDSMDFDSPLSEAVHLIKLIPEKSVNWSYEEFGVYVGIDFEIGVSGNHMVSLHNSAVDGNSVTADFSGKRRSIEKLTSKFDKYNVKYNFNVEEKTEEYLSLSELFKGKQVFSLDIGKTSEVISGKVQLEFQ